MRRVKHPGCWGQVDVFYSGVNDIFFNFAAEDALHRTMKARGEIGGPGWLTLARAL